MFKPYKPLGTVSIPTPTATLPLEAAPTAAELGAPAPGGVATLAVPPDVHPPAEMGELTPLPLQQQGRASVALVASPGTYWVRGVTVIAHPDGSVHVKPDASKPADAESVGAFTSILTTAAGEQIFVVVARMTAAPAEAETPPPTVVEDTPLVARTPEEEVPLHDL